MSSILSEEQLKKQMEESNRGKDEEIQRLKDLLKEAKKSVAGETDAGQKPKEETKTGESAKKAEDDAADKRKAEDDTASQRKTKAEDTDGDQVRRAAKRQLSDEEIRDLRSRSPAVKKKEEKYTDSQGHTWQMKDKPSTGDKDTTGGSPGNEPPYQQGALRRRVATTLWYG